MGLVLWEAGAVLADEFGEVGGLVGGLGGGVDEGAGAEFGEGEVVGGDHFAFVEHFVALAVDEEAPVEGEAFGFGMLGTDGGGAVGGDGVVPAGLVAHLVEVGEVLQEAFAGAFGRDFGAVEVRFFAFAVVGAEADDVAFVGGDVGEFVLTVEAADGGVFFADFFAGFDGEADGRGVGKLEADDGVSHPGGAPVVNEHVDAGELGQADGAGFPAGREVGGGAVVAVADVVEGDFVAVDFGPGELGDIGLPLAVVARGLGGPPGEDEGAGDGGEGEGFPEAAGEQDDADDEDQEGPGGDGLKVGEVEAEGAEGPGGEGCGGDPEEAEEGESAEFEESRRLS